MLLVFCDDGADVGVRGHKFKSHGTLRAFVSVDVYCVKGI